MLAPLQLLKLIPNLSMLLSFRVLRLIIHASQNFGDATIHRGAYNGRIPYMVFFLLQHLLSCVTQKVEAHAFLERRNS